LVQNNILWVSECKFAIAKIQIGKEKIEEKILVSLNEWHEWKGWERTKVT
jgi:hypothetical protein